LKAEARIKGVWISESGELVSVHINNVISIYRVSTGELVTTYNDVPTSASKTCFSRDDKVFYIADSDGFVSARTVPEGELIFKRKAHDLPVNDFELFDNDNQIVSVSNDGVKLWDAHTGDPKATFYLFPEKKMMILLPDN